MPDETRRGPLVLTSLGSHSLPAPAEPRPCSRSEHMASLQRERGSPSPPGPCEPLPALPIFLPRAWGAVGFQAATGAQGQSRSCGRTDGEKAPHLGSEGDQKAVSLEHLGASQIRSFLWGCLGPETTGICPHPAGEATFQALPTYHTLFCASASGPAVPTGAEPAWLPLCCRAVSQGQGRGWGSVGA